MSKSFEPNPPSRKPGGFPKTTTVPEGWVVDDSAAFSSNGTTQHEHPVVDEMTSGETVEDENLFTRRLEPFPTKADTHGSWL